jgi:hypothetical protein
VCALTIETVKQPKTEPDRIRAVERLVEGGASRLTAERIVAIDRGLAEVGRARRHATARS